MSVTISNPGDTADTPVGRFTYIGPNELKGGRCYRRS